MTAVDLIRPHAEEYHPFRLLGIAQAAMEQVGRLDDLAEIKATVAEALARITVPPIEPLAINERIRGAEYGPGTVIGIDSDKDAATVRWDFEVNKTRGHVLTMSLRWAETECVRGVA